MDRRLAAKQKAPGKRVLQVAGVIGIAYFGFICLLLLIDFALRIGLVEVGGSGDPFWVGYAWFFMSYMNLYFWSLLFISIMAVKYCGTLEKANFLKLLGMIGVALNTVDLIIGIISFAVSPYPILPLSLGFVAQTLFVFALSISFIIGASMNIKASKGRV